MAAVTTGPMQATTGGTRTAIPTAATKFSTVDDDVKVTTSAAATASATGWRASSAAAGACVRYASTSST